MVTSLEDLAEVISQAVLETTKAYQQSVISQSLHGHAMAVTSGLCSHRLGYGLDLANGVVVCLVQNGDNYENEVAMLTYEASEFKTATVINHIKTYFKLSKA